ncbi:hypothetical protein [Lentzea guizhouensis]|uniref:hypothetical protein n=1 Tax=Lentzea guizhouensis TaxID=1586287 RepID=UPI0012B69BBD|nr:hypothetical protein [Lentzea guizhouensis]
MSPEGVRRVAAAVTEVVAAARPLGVDRLYPFGGFVVRDGANRDEVVDRVRRMTRAFLHRYPPKRAEVKALHRHVRDVLGEVADRLRRDDTSHLTTPGVGDHGAAAAAVLAGPGPGRGPVRAVAGIRRRRPGRARSAAPPTRSSRSPAR